MVLMLYEGVYTKKTAVPWVMLQVPENHTRSLYYIVLKIDTNSTEAERQQFNKIEWVNIQLSGLP